MFAVLIAGYASARAQNFEQALTRLSADSYAETDAAIGEIAASGNPMAATIIAALQNGRLFFSGEKKQVFIRDQSGHLLDAASGQPAADEAALELKPVRINNRLRRSIEAALGGLSLLAPDPGKRLDAAQAVFHTTSNCPLSLISPI